MTDKHLDAQITGTCIFGFSQLLRDLINNIWKHQHYYKTLPLILHRDILEKLADIENLEELNIFMRQYSNKRCNISHKNIRHMSGTISIHYKDLNIINLYLYLIKFVNYPELFQEFAEKASSLPREEPAQKVKYLTLMLLLLKDKLDMIKSKQETLKFIQDRRKPDKTTPQEFLRLDAHVKRITRTTLEIIKQLTKIEKSTLELNSSIDVSHPPENTSVVKPTPTGLIISPKYMLSMPVILLETGILNQSKAYMESILEQRYLNLKQILSEVGSQITFWKIIAENIVANLQSKWFHIEEFDTNDFDSSKLYQGDKEVEEKYSKKYHSQAAEVIKTLYEMAYLLNREEFYHKQEETQVDKLGGKLLFKLSRLLFFCFLKVQLVKLEDSSINSVKVDVLKAFYLT